MTSNAKRLSAWFIAMAMFVVSMYSALGVLQAGSIHGGIVVMSGGAIVETGTHDELMARGAFYELLSQAQMPLSS